MSNNKTNVENQKKTNSPSHPKMSPMEIYKKIYHDNESKYDGDPRAGIGNKNYQDASEDDPKDKVFAKQYLESPISKAMDDTNKEAMKVWAEHGEGAAVVHMMQQAGGDYGRMRCMFG